MLSERRVAGDGETVRSITLLVTLCIGARFLSPPIELFGTDQIRLEDFPALLIVLSAFFHFVRAGEIRASRFALPYFLYLFAVTGLHVTLGGLDGASFAFGGKEIAYFGFFLGGYYTIRDDPSWLYQVTRILGWVLLLYAAGQYLRGEVAYYGIGSPTAAPKSPSNAGLTYGSAAIFVTVLSAIKNRGTVPFPDKLLAGGLAAAAILTVSRVTYALLGGFFLTAWLGPFGIWKNAVRGSRVEWLARWMARFGLAALVIVGLLATSGPSMGDGGAGEAGDSYLDMVVLRVSYLPSSLAERREIAEANLDRVDSPLALVAGRGRGAFNADQGGELRNFTLNADNQWTRDLYEIGILGTLIWLGMLVLYGLSLQGPLYLRGLLVSLAAGYVLAGVGADVLLLTGSAPMFWATLGVIVGSGWRGERA